MTIESRKIGPITITHNTDLPDEITFGIESTGGDDWKRVEILTSVTPPEARRIEGYLKSLLNTHIMDTDYGEHVERFVSVHIEGV